MNDGKTDLLVHIVYTNVKRKYGQDKKSGGLFKRNEYLDLCRGG